MGGDDEPGDPAADEGLARTQTGAPLSLGGIYRDGELHGAVQIPNALSLLAHRDPDAVVLGLDRAPSELEPPVNVVHRGFQIMVGIGFALVALGGWFALTWWRRRALPRSRPFLVGAVLAGPAAAVAVSTR
ncbi:cytochrome ubiquinol oxidase subunit I [Pseudonocardia sp. RS010]|uniref:cytochrome ubiquinol oxidase subunit I n=1 Tax=Pseudonocardia sp. RS010 TaxID=3385979 RepID=UPI0039A1F4C1